MANKLNTTFIGDEFESKSLDIIKKVIEEERLGHLSNYLKIFQKKGYYSALRKKDIIFDLTIEVWPPGATRFVMIYIIECKDYKTRVPVNRITDFHSRIQQVTGVNVKGIFISNSPLMKGAYNTAEGLGMMVIQAESSESFDIILHKTTLKNKHESIPMLIETIDLSLIDEGVVLLEKLVDQKILNVFNEVIDTSRVGYNIDRLSKEDIESIVNGELNNINPRILSNGNILTSKKLIEYLISFYGITFSYLRNNNDFLGSCDINNGIIAVNESIKGTPREFFIIGHEFGHFILHQKLSIGQKLYESFNDSEYNFRTGKNDLNNPRHWIEWQANYFASSLTLPKELFLYWMWKTQDNLNLTRGRIYLDDKYINTRNFSELVNKLSYIFGVSKTTVIYKLKELDLINDQSRLKSISQIFVEYSDQLFI